MANLVDDISDSYCTVEPIYNNTIDLTHNNQKFLFDFEVEYSKVPVGDSDGEADFTFVETFTKHQEQEYGRDCFIGHNDEQIKTTVCEILYEIDVPIYRGIVTTFMEEIKSIMKSPMEKLSKIKVKIEVVVPVFPIEEDIGVEDGDFHVAYEVGPASIEAIQEHLEIVTVIDNNSVGGDCVICMEKIEVGSDELVSRMPCEHVYHRSCIAKWLEVSAICPLCRQVYPV